MTQTAYHPQTLTIALQWRAAGLSPLPCKTGTKWPALKAWDAYQQTPADHATLQTWFRTAGSIGLAAGVGGAEFLDLDNKGAPGADELYQQLHAIVEQLAPGLMERLYIERTRSGGYHLAWRSEACEGNLKLALRPATEAERAANPKMRAVTLVETRGRGGFIVVAPSEGYTVLQGSIEALPAITPAERQILLSAARSFDRTPAQQATTIAPPYSTRFQDTRDFIADYNNSHDVRAELERYGARLARTARDGWLYHCPCPGHSHNDQNPSLHIKAATSRRAGTYAAFGYSPSCVFYTPRGHYNAAFDVVCKLEGWDAREAVKRLSGPQERRQPVAPIEAPAAPKKPRGRPSTRHASAEQTLALMEQHPDATVADLAQLRGVCERTIKRDRAALAAAGRLPTTSKGDRYSRPVVAVETEPQAQATEAGDRYSEAPPVIERAHALTRDPVVVPQPQPAPQASPSPRQATAGPAPSAPAPEGPPQSQVYPTALQATADPYRARQALDHAHAGRWLSAGDAARAILDPELQRQTLAQIDELQHLAPAREALESGDHERAALALFCVPRGHRAQEWRRLLAVIEATRAGLQKVRAA